MRLIKNFEEVQPFEVLAPARQSVPFIFNSPHSGRCYPRSFAAASRLELPALRKSEDAFVDDLFVPVVNHGAVLMRAHFPRAYLDVNREPYELDPAMFRGELPGYVNSRSIRVAGGLGTVARLVSESHEIYHSPLDVDDALARIEGLYKPYHQTLRRLLARSHVAFGYAVLIDCHSMPSAVRGPDGRPKPDIILGDRYGTSCADTLIETAAQFLRGRGYTVSRNKPYAGGFITEHYGRPSKGLHAMQIEVNRSLYMDEAKYQISDGYAQMRPDLEALAQTLTGIDAKCFWQQNLAAE